MILGGLGGFDEVWGGLEVVWGVSTDRNNDFHLALR